MPDKQTYDDIPAIGKVVRKQQAAAAGNPSRGEDRAPQSGTGRTRPVGRHYDDDEE